MSWGSGYRAHTPVPLVVIRWLVRWLMPLLTVIEGEGLLDHAAALGKYTLERLGKFQAEHPVIKRVDGKGLMVGVEMADANGEPIPEFRNQIESRCFMNGLLTLGCGTSAMRIAPPLVITEDEMAHGLDIMEHIIADLEEEYASELGFA